MQQLGSSSAAQRYLAAPWQSHVLERSLHALPTPLFSVRFQIGGLLGHYAGVTRRADAAQTDLLWRALFIQTSPQYMQINRNPCSCAHAWVVPYSCRSANCHAQYGRTVACTMPIKVQLCCACHLKLVLHAHAILSTWTIMMQVPVVTPGTSHALCLLSCSASHQSVWQSTKQTSLPVASYALTSLRACTLANPWALPAARHIS